MKELLIAMLGTSPIFMVIVVVAIWVNCDWKTRLAGILAGFFFWVIASGAMVIRIKDNANKWNNGYCQCGTHWELVSVAAKTKYYVCPNCYAEIQIN